MLTLTNDGPPSHTVKFLRSLAEEQDLRLVGAFPRDHHRQRAWFNTINEAYVKARYSKHFEISEEALVWLGERTAHLLELVTASVTSISRSWSAMSRAGSRSAKIRSSGCWLASPLFNVASNRSSLRYGVLTTVSAQFDMVDRSGLWLEKGRSSFRCGAWVPVRDLSHLN